MSRIDVLVGSSSRRTAACIQISKREQELEDLRQIWYSTKSIVTREESLITRVVKLPVRLLVEVLFLTSHLGCSLAHWLGSTRIPVEEIVIVLIFPRSRFTGRLSSARIPVRERRGDTTRGFCFKPLPVQFPWTDRQETSMSIEALRKHLLELLEGGHAHLDFEAAIADLPVGTAGVRPPGLPHTPWRLLEHMRIAQWDILRFSDRSRSRLARVPRRLLARGRRPARRCRLGPRPWRPFGPT